MTGPAFGAGGGGGGGRGNVGNAGGVLRRGLFPELAVSPALASPELFAAVVLDGIRAGNGMVSFSHILDAAGAEDVRAYLIDRANAALQRQQAARAGQ